MLEPQEDMREESTDEYGNPVSNKEMRRIREGPKEGRHRGDTAAVGFSLTPNGIIKSGDQGSFWGKQVPMAVVNNDSRGYYMFTTCQEGLCFLCTFSLASYMWRDY